MRLETLRKIARGEYRGGATMNYYRARYLVSQIDEAIAKAVEKARTEDNPQYTGLMDRHGHLLAGNVALREDNKRLLAEIESLKTNTQRDEALMASYNADIGALVREKGLLTQKLKKCEHDLGVQRSENVDLRAKLNPAYDETHTDLRERLRIVERELAEEKEQVRRLEEIRVTLRDKMSEWKKRANWMRRKYYSAIGVIPTSQKWDGPLCKVSIEDVGCPSRSEGKAHTFSRPMCPWPPPPPPQHAVPTSLPGQVEKLQNQVDDLKKKLGVIERYAYQDRHPELYGPGPLLIAGVTIGVMLSGIIVWMLR